MSANSGYQSVRKEIPFNTDINRIIYIYYKCKSEEVINPIFI